MQKDTQPMQKPDGCLKCGKKLIPDEEAKNDATGEWDGHTFKYQCSCHDENLRVSIG